MMNKVLPKFGRGGSERSRREVSNRATEKNYSKNNQESRRETGQS